MKRKLRLVIVLSSMLIAPRVLADASSIDDSQSLARAEPATKREHGSWGYGAGARVTWQPDWHRFGWVNGTIIGVGLGAAGLGLVVGPNSDTRETQTSFDESVRDWARPDSPGARRAVRVTSDVLVATTIAQGFVVDSFLNAAWYRASQDVAWQLAFINAQVLAINIAVQTWTANLVARDRPYGRTCGDQEQTSDGSTCTGGYRYRSFYSGHASSAFAMATAMCTHHAHVPLYVGRGRWVPCATGFVLASATAAARVVADQHYATDVLVGATVGSAIGGIVPWLHYAAGYEPGKSSSSKSVQLTIVPGPSGLAVNGIF